MKHGRQRHWNIGGRRSSAEDARIEAPYMGGDAGEGGLGRGTKFMNFFDLKIVSYGAFLVLFSRFMCPMDCSCMINFIEVPVCA